MKSIIVDSLSAIPFQNENQKHLMLTMASNAWEKNHMEDRLLEGIDLIKTHLKLTPSQLKSIEKLTLNLKQSHNTLIKSDFDPQLVNSIYAKGREFLKKNDFESAANIYTVLVLLDSLSPEGWISLGIAEHHLAHDDKAEIDFGIALGIAPQDLNVLYHVGRFYQDRGNKKIACEFYQLAVDSEKSDPSEIKNQCRRLLA